MISLTHLDLGSLSRTFIASCSKSWCRRKTIETETSPAALGDCRCCDCNEQSHCCWSPFECGYWHLLFTFLPNLNGITLCKSPDKGTSRRRCRQKPGSHHQFQPFHFTTTHNLQYMANNRAAFLPNPGCAFGFACVFYGHIDFPVGWRLVGGRCRAPCGYQVSHK